MKKDFKKYVDQFKTPIENITFKSGTTKNVINQWVAKETENHINKFLDRGFDEEYKMLLVSAVYFKGHFLKSFQRDAVAKRNFYTPDHKEPVQVEFMDKTGLYNYCECSNLKAQIVEITLEGKDVCIVMILPNDKNGLSTLESKIDDIFTPTAFTEERVNVLAPKFKFESKLNNLKKTLQQMGMKRPFTSDADFGNLAADSENLFINDIMQRTCIEITEEDIESNLKAAGSAKKFQQPTKTFVADHPFIFYIKVRDIVVLIGRVVTPL